MDRMWALHVSVRHNVPVPASCISVCVFGCVRIWNKDGSLAEVQHLFLSLGLLNRIMIPLWMCLHRSAQPVTLCTAIAMVIKARCALFCHCQQSTSVLWVFYSCHSAPCRNLEGINYAPQQCKHTAVPLLVSRMLKWKEQLKTATFE